ncbi:DUF1003 domain-containing protein [Azoarcus sp. TTM-91]|uniref:DUF1003 domain-containing protein n=1 Tax=Azoarcus sp. TTM-91 TaxID=2691581 RepID=UPI00145D1E59|nr:DUF1003 domain-containing protein [Azoarcus sp. TTM-91]NMG37051.1 DUF1003 domain-containing protein [Azoarcus sp. TTM-91]
MKSSAEIAQDNPGDSRAREIFRNEWARLTPSERKVVEKVLKRLGTPRDLNREFDDNRSVGERTADAIADFGGSWTFILLFIALLAFWALLNTEILGPRHDAFDPYPYVFLNLILSMLAAVQAPIIMMSQKRQALRDRLDAEVDHEVNVRAELAIRQLDERLLLIEQELKTANEMLRRDRLAEE